MHEIRLALVHHDRLYRECLAEYLALREEMVIVCNCPSLESAAHDLFEFTPDILLLNYENSRSHFELTLLERVDFTAKTIVVGVPNTDADILACIEELGASGYVLIDDSLGDLIENVHAVMNGQTLCSPRIANLAFSRMSALARRQASLLANSPKGTCLTRRESEIAQLIDDGLSNKEIAARLHIEISTVKNHVHNMLDKLQIRNRHSAVKYLKSHNIPTVSHS
ncbi:MAG: response regulator transcription factor [Nitrospiraceae bacterium]